MGVFIAVSFETQESMVAASRRYLATESSGDAIDQGLLLLAISVVLGFLTSLMSKRKR